MFLFERHYLLFKIIFRRKNFSSAPQVPVKSVPNESFIGLVRLRAKKDSARKKKKKIIYLFIKII